MAIKAARENAAANAVLDHLTVISGVLLTGRKWDDGTMNAMHDFYLDGGGHHIALEVTTIADGDRVGRDHRWAREAPDGWVAVDGLAGCWIAYQDGETEASSVISALRVHLPELEAAGIGGVNAGLWQEHAFSPEALRPPGFEASRGLHQVGIVEASRVLEASAALLNDHAGAVQIVRGSGFSRPRNRNFPANFVSQQLRDALRSDVGKLLAVPDATSRHLWMWVELAEGLGMLRSFEVEGLPNVDLSAHGIDAVWLGRSPAPEIVAGHLWRRDGGWSDFTAVRNEADVEDR